MLLQRLRLAVWSPVALSPSKAKKNGCIVVRLATALDQKSRLGAFVATIDDPTFDEPFVMEETFHTRRGLITYHVLYKVLSYFASFLSAHQRPIFIYIDDFMANLKLHMILNDKEFSRERASLWDTLNSFNTHDRPVYIVALPSIYREQRKLRKVVKQILAKALSKL